MYNKINIDELKFWQCFYLIEEDLGPNFIDICSLKFIIIIT